MVCWSSQHCAFTVACFFNVDSATILQHEFRRHFNVRKKMIKVPTSHTMEIGVNYLRLTAALP